MRVFDVMCEEGQELEGISASYRIMCDSPIPSSQVPKPHPVAYWPRLGMGTGAVMGGFQKETCNVLPG